MRLAHEQGLLSQRSLNYFQRWALMYWIWLDRRMTGEDLQSKLEQQTFNLAPDRWELIYKDKILGAIGLSGDDGEIQIGVDELDELDQYMDQQEQKFQEVLGGTHGLRGDGLVDYREHADRLVWGEWT